MRLLVRTCFDGAEAISISHKFKKLKRFFCAKERRTFERESLEIDIAMSLFPLVRR